MYSKRFKQTLRVVTFLVKYRIKIFRREYFPTKQERIAEIKSVLGKQSSGFDMTHQPSPVTDAFTQLIADAMLKHGKTVEGRKK